MQRSSAHSPTFPSLHLRHSSFSNPSVTLPMSQLILQLFRSFTYVTAHSPTLPLLHLRHCSFSYPSFDFPTSLALHLRHLASRPCTAALLILQPFRHFTYVTAHSPTFPSLYLSHSSFSNPSIALPTSQLILQLFRCFTYVTAHSPIFPSPYLRHSSFSNLSVTSPASRAQSPTFPSLHLRHSSSSNPSVALPTSQLIRAHSPTLL